MKQSLFRDKTEPIEETPHTIRIRCDRHNISGLLSEPMRGTPCSFYNRHYISLKSIDGDFHAMLEVVQEFKTNPGPWCAHPGKFHLDLVPRP